METINKILVVEDQEGPLDAIKCALSETLPALNIQAEITYVTNFDDALGRIRSDEHFELILLDHRMPRVNVGDLEDRDFDAFSEALEDIGYGLIPEIRRLHPESIIIGTSSMSSELRSYPHKPDETVKKSDLYNPEKEFAPLLRRLIDTTKE